jgi:C-terminal processing protease CtpA/Prc
MLDSQAVANYFGVSNMAEVSNENFIRTIYKNTLNKTIDGSNGTIKDAIGIAYWVGRLTGETGDKMSRAEMIVKFITIAQKSTTLSGKQFSNRVEVSNYMADMVEIAPSDYITSTSFSSGLRVTSDKSSVEVAKNSIDLFTNGNSLYGYAIINNYEKSVSPIVKIYSRLEGESSWGENLAPSELAVGYRFASKFKTSLCNRKYQIKAVYKSGKDMIKNVYLACNKTADIWFWMYRSTIPSENIDCSLKGKNKMLYDIMKDKYLWYRDTRNLDYEEYDSLDRLLGDLKYKKYDRWSYITTTEENNDYFEAGKYGGTGYGLWYFDDRVYIGFVYKNSPAYKVGLKRGVEILEINGKTIKEIEDASLWGTIMGKDEVGVRIDLKVNIDSTIKNITLTKDTVYINSVLHHDILNIDNKKIGYLVFKTFIEPSRAELKEVFSKFKAENIEELVLDLRYNGGGRLDIAQYLASLIGGDYTVDNVFEMLQYNDRFSHWNEAFNFTKEESALGLNHIYVITTQGTASASESVINGLKPFIDVSLIGSKTHGKAVGMNGVDFCNVYVAPITFKVLNAEEEGDYFEGISVDCGARDDILHSFGDLNEGMLKETLYYIKNGKCSPSSKEKRVEKRGAEQRDIEKRAIEDKIKNEKLYQGFRAEIGAF